MKIGRSFLGVLRSFLVTTSILGPAVAACSPTFEDCRDTHSCPPSIDASAGAGASGAGASGGTTATGGNSTSGGAAGGTASGGVTNGGSSSSGGSAAGTAGTAQGGGAGNASSDAGKGDASADGTTGSPDATVGEPPDGAADGGPPLTCAAGFADCDGKRKNGCEINVTNDPDHCGSCAVACATTGTSARACNNKVCAPTCDGAHLNCDTDGKNGCEASVLDDPANCGACRLACSKANASATTCSGGVCKPTCNSGFGDCTRTAPVGDNGCETDLSQTSSCGACFHNCLGGTCTQFRCDAMPLATAREMPASLVVTGSSVYWVEGGTTDGQVVKETISGTSTTAIATNQALPADIATDGQYIYWCNSLNSSASIQRIPVAGGAASTIVSDGATPVQSPCPIAVDGTYIYWTDYNIRFVYRAKKDSLNSGITALSPSLNVAGFDLAIDATDIYYTPLTVEKIPITGFTGTSETDIPRIGITESVALDSTYLYYYTHNASANVLARSPKTLAAGTEQFLTPAITTKGRGLAVDATNVYFPATDGLYRVPKAGGTPIKMSPNVDVTAAIVVTTDAIYWANTGTGASTGSIMKLAL